ncbi:serine/threonine-protein kinase [Luteolibacter sp. Populi]|uniref:serine/threonine-protein kinase n=1 Tax=Luteolibacter sp. Populi TaxID=3230487 RepID=UPI003466EA6D
MSLSPVQQLFQEAFDLPEEDRESFIDEATDDESLRSRVRSLLASARRSPGFLGSPTLDSQGNAVPDLQLCVLGPGSRIGPYEILRKLGSGGGGIVFLARQEQPLRREVSLKIMRSSLDDDEPRWRFEIERKAIERMEHPGIARVLDAGLTDDDRPWIAMEYISGEPITTWCDAHRLSLEDRGALMASVCDAVHHAHQKGVLHRDLKPSNVLVMRTSDGSPRPCLIDFGIARLSDTGADASQTRPGRLPGTPAYMSPEQIEGRTDALDARSDIFSLGVILYELLVGASPFRDPNSVSREVTLPGRSTRLSSAEAVADLAKQRGQTSQAWRREIRGDLALIALKCLRIDPQERYASADALGADLRAFVAHLPVTAHRPTLRYLASRMIRRHPVASLSAASVMFLLVLCSLAILHAQRQAVIQRELARAERARSEDLFTGFARLIVAGDPEHGRPRDYPLGQAVIDFARHLPGELTRDPRTEARARHTLAHALQGMGESAQARQQFAASLALLDRLPPSESADLLPTVLFGNAISIAQTQPDLASRQLIRAEELLRATKDPDDAYMRIRVLCQLSVLAHDKGDFAQAGSMAANALSSAEKLKSADPDLVARCLWTLARVERSMGRVPEARALQERRAGLLASKYGDDSPLTWDARAELASLDVTGPDPDLHLATLRGLSQKTEEHFGPNHYQALARWIDYARALASVGRREASIEIYRGTFLKAEDPSFTDAGSLAKWREEYERLLVEP